MQVFNNILCNRAVVRDEPFDIWGGGLGFLVRPEYFFTINLKPQYFFPSKCEPNFFFILRISNIKLYWLVGRIHCDYGTYKPRSTASMTN